MTDFKAGDFTNGKMNEIFKSAERESVDISHKQFGDFVLVSKRSLEDAEAMEVRRVSLLFKMLDDYKFRYENFYANCLLLDGDEEKNTSNIIGYINSCMEPSDCQFEPFATTSVIVAAHNDTYIKEYLYEMQYIIKEYLIEVYAQWCDDDRPLNIHQQAIAIRDNNVRLNTYLANAIDDESIVTNLIITVILEMTHIIPLFHLNYTGDSDTDTFDVLFKRNEDTGVHYNGGVLDVTGNFIDTELTITRVEKD